MKSIRIPAAGLALAAVVLVGCAGLSVKEESITDRVCVNVRQINAFGALDDRHVLVKAGSGHYYLFTVDERCGGIKFARSIVIADPSTRVCGNGFSFLSFEHPGAGSIRCRIKAIEEVEDEDAALALIESRTEQLV